MCCLKMFDVRQCYRKWFLFVLSILQTDYYLTHVPLVSHIYASVNWVSIGTGKGLLPVWRQHITWTIADLLSIVPLGTDFIEI